MTSANPLLRSAVVLLERAGKSEDAAIWTNASKMLSRPGGTSVEVNVARLSRVAGKGGALFVPGKVLGTGAIDKKLVVGAFSFSEAARKKIGDAGGTALSVEQFVKKHPKGSGVKIVG